jgi:hypothetical protein
MAEMGEVEHLPMTVCEEDETESEESGTGEDCDDREDVTPVT